MIPFEHSRLVKQKYRRHFTGCFGEASIKSVEQMTKATAKLLEECRRMKEEFAETTPQQVRHWQEVFSSMGASSKYQSSIVALWNRFKADNRLYEILPVVDFYNAVSLRYLTPMAAYDADKIVGGIFLRYAQKGEPFTPLGNPKQVEKTKNGEIVYADERKVICRYWNLRDCDQTRITGDTRSVILFADLVADSAAEAQQLAQKIQEALSSGFGTSVPHSLAGISDE